MEITPEIRLKRFLHITSENNVYAPGCRFFLKMFNRENIPCLAELIQDGKEDFILDTIMTVFNENSSCHPEASLYILAEMAKNTKLRHKTLDVAKIVCKKAESFIVFIKFTVEVKPRGMGRSFRKFIKDWYLSKDHLPLAETIGAVNKYRGWRHQDILKLGHVSCDDPAKGASLKFATHGADEMKKHFGEIKEAERVVSYLCTVDQYRKEKDPMKVAAKIESYMLGKEHIDANLLSEKKIWQALLRQMPVKLVLEHIQFMNKRKLFRGQRSWDMTFVETVAEGLTRPGADKADVTVNKVFKTLIDYENAARIKLELASKMKQLTKKPPVICPDIIKALIELMDIIYEQVKPTEKNYFIAIESSSEMLKRRCKMSRYIMLVEAAAFIAHYFYRTEKNVKVVTFTDTTVKPFLISKDETVKQVIDNLKNGNNSESVNTHKSKSNGSIINRMQGEMKKSDEDTDVCIIVKSMLDNNSLSGVNFAHDNNSKIKYVVCNLCGITPKNSKLPDHRDLLIMFGFDEKICEVISSFAREYF